MTVNQATLDLIKHFEVLRLSAYPDPATGGSPWTIGYGTTASAGVGIIPVKGMTITEAQADQYLKLAVDKFGAMIQPMIKVPVTPNEWGACVSLTYNIGPGNFRSSSVLRLLNAGNKAGAAKAFAMWNKGGGKVMPGLVIRRAAESALFLVP